MSRDLEKFRMSTGLTQEEAAKSLGIHPTTLNKYEAGVRFPSSKVLAQMTRLYNVEMDSLIKGGKKITNNKKEDEAMLEKLNRLEKELLDLYRENRKLKEMVLQNEKKDGAHNRIVNGD